MRYKMTNNIKFVITRFVFFSSSKCTKICFRRWGSLRRSPRSLRQLGRGIPLPIPFPARRLRRLELDAYGAPRFSGPLNTKSWLGQCCQPSAVVLLHSLEFLACPCLVITIYLNFAATAKTFFFHLSFPGISI